MFYTEVALTGMALGCLYALAGTGLILTYTATGVFNFAHFPTALLGAYLMWQLNAVWGVPMLIALVIVVGVLGPLLGIGLERLVFRPLQRRGASTSEKLVATLGVVVLTLAVIRQVWGPGVKGSTEEPVPRLFPPEPFNVGDMTFDWENVGFAVTTLVLGAALYYVLRRTYLGTTFRAVVDRRELAELSTVDTGRISGLAWALGSAVAMLTGILYAPPSLEPFRILFFGIECFSVAVVARLVSIPVAIATGILVLGGGRAILETFDPLGTSGFWGDTWDRLLLNLSTILLFGALVLYRRLDEVGTDASSGQGLVATRLGRRGGAHPATVVTVLLVALGALLVPVFVDDLDMRHAQQTVAFVVIFASIVCITGFSGHITLGQATTAGLGAFFTARAVNGWDLPVLAGMVVGGMVALLCGLVAGYPALRRKGLFLALTTLSLGFLIDRLVFNTDLFDGGPGGLVVRRPSLFGFELTTDTRFYYFELVIAALALLLARNLRAGRLGRILGAMRDSETAARSVGIDLRRYKLFIFAISSFMAGIGGALLTQSNGAWDRETYNPLFSLFWFTAVVVAGISSLAGAVLAAFLYVMLPVFLDVDTEVAIGLFGLAALFLGRLAGGIVGNAQRLWAAFVSAAQREYRRARRDAAEPVREAGDGLVPSEFAERVIGVQADG